MVIQLPNEQFVVFAVLVEFDGTTQGIKACLSGGTLDLVQAIKQGRTPLEAVTEYKESIKRKYAGVDLIKREIAHIPFDAVMLAALSQISLPLSAPIIVYDHEMQNSPLLVSPFPEPVDSAVKTFFESLSRANLDVARQFTTLQDDIQSRYQNDPTLLAVATKMIISALDVMIEYFHASAPFDALHEKLREQRSQFVSAGEGRLRPVTPEPTKFSEIFIVDNWREYVNALAKTTPPLLDKAWKFHGKKGYKGVICSWINDLKNVHQVIDPKIDRQQLAKVLNEEIPGFKVGEDGRTFDQYSESYQMNFKTQLQELLPKAAEGK